MKECPACRRCFPDEVNHCPDDGDATTFSIVGEPILDGRYQLERRIGHGGMGMVFQARHIFLKSTHAIKVILPDLVGNDPMLITRFRQEAIAAAAVHHHNIIAVTDFGVARGTMPFLVMEFIRGRSLHTLLAEERVLAPERALEIMTPICAGVSAAHRHNIVHRDLKPLNIMLEYGVSVSEGLKILDFGLAKIKSGELLGSFVQAKTSGLMGSPFYMAPEQWGDEEPDARADIYSLGVLLYQMLGGDVPFKGPSLPSIMNKHLTQEPPSLKTLGVYVPPAIEEVVRYALEKKAANRPQTVEEFITSLRAATARNTVVRQRVQSSQPGYSTAEQTLPDLSFDRSASFGDATAAAPFPDQQGIHLEETQQNLDQQVERLARELAEAQSRAEEARLRVEEATRKRAEEEAARRRAEEEAERKRAEEEAARLRAEEEARQRAEEEAAQRRAEEEAARQHDLEVARKRAEEEAARRHAEEEANRLAQEVEEIKLRAEEARQHAEEEASRRAEEETARKLAEAKAEELELKFEEAQRRAEEARARAEEEARLNFEKEAARRRAEEEAERRREEEAARLHAEEEAARRRAEEEANRFAREIAEAQRSVEEARLRAEEEARRRAEEETARRRAEEEASRLAHEVEEAKRLAEEVRRLVEEEAKTKAEEEARRRLEEERRRAAAAIERQSEPAQTRALDPLEPQYGEATLDYKLAQTGETRNSQEPTEVVQTFYTTPALDRGATQQSQSRDGLGSGGNQAREESGHQWGASTAQDFGTQSPGAARQKKSLSRIITMAAILVLVAGVGGYALYRALSGGEPARTTVEGKPSDPSKTGQSTAHKPDMIFIAGGTFKMGADGVEPTEDNLKQTPSHAVSVSPFFIDRTEVTNAEYAEFVHAMNYQPPEGWGGTSPPAGREQWPVTDVSLDDAEAFAAWRSKRDGVVYRLPTEEEWEYAARGGKREYRFPWGNDWAENRANLGTGAGKDADFPKAVGSYPQGATADGVLDMIGNVYEWTSSKASYYSGNPNKLKPNEEGFIVVRGGAHQSMYPTAVSNRGGREFPATLRLWVKRDTKSFTRGFRLARDASAQ